MEPDKQRKIYPEDIELNYALDEKNMKKHHEISFRRRLHNQKYENITIAFKIPISIMDGQIIRIKEEGHVGENRVGNVYIRINMLYKGFKRKGCDAYIEKHINSSQARNGSEITINFLGETLNVKIPDNIKDGQTLSIKNRGYRGVNPKERGNLFIKIIIDKDKNYENKYNGGYIKNNSNYSANNLNNNYTNKSPFKFYENKICELENIYQTKEKIVHELIEKCFSPPQLTYNRFIDSINDCNVIFYKQKESATNIINMVTGHTPKVDEELKKKLNTLKSIIEKIDELTDELIISLSNSDEQYDEVKDLLDDMQKLVDSVKEYDL